MVFVYAHFSKQTFLREAIFRKHIPIYKIVRFEVVQQLVAEKEGLLLPVLRDLLELLDPFIDLWRHPLGCGQHGLRGGFLRHRALLPARVRAVRIQGSYQKRGADNGCMAA